MNTRLFDEEMLDGFLKGESVIDLAQEMGIEVRDIEEAIRREVRKKFHVEQADEEEE